MTMNDGNGSTIKPVFEATAALVQSSSSSDEYVPEDIKLQLYGLYKRCTEGKACESTCPEPAMWNIVGIRKRNAWKRYNSLDLDAAMKRYVEIVSEFQNSTGYECKRLYEHFLENSEAIESSDAGNESPAHDISNRPNNVFETHNRRSPGLVEKVTGIKPFIARGELDISCSDLFYALRQCLKPRLSFLEAPKREIVRLEEEISNEWRSHHFAEATVVTGLSVRSLVDLYLLSKSYPSGSEVVIVPPIGIEGMMDVIQYHGLKIIPVDIGDYESKPIIHVDIEKVKSKLSAKTVAVLVVHPFGLICMDDSEMKSLRRVIDDHDSEIKTEIWEDCAECYGARKGYTGSKYANIHFFSFGMIKTATALGGGICVINECFGESTKLLGDTMKRIQHTMHGQQTRQEYIVKILKAFALQLFSKCPTMLGILVYLLGLLHINYDHIVTSSVKGFPTQCDNTALSKTKLQRAHKLVKRLRKSPSPALLSLLYRRLRKSEATSKMIERRKERCEKMYSFLKQKIPTMEFPDGNDSCNHLYWLCPFLVNNPIDTCRSMSALGYDVPSGTSQLGSVTKFIWESNEYSDSCPNTEQMMAQILYLPTSSKDMIDSEMWHLATTLKENMDPSAEKDSNRVYMRKDYLFLFRILLMALLLDMMTFRSVSLRNTTFMFCRFICYQLLPIVLSAFVAIFIFLHFIRIYLGDFYIRCSNTFSKYNSIMSQRDNFENEISILQKSLQGSGATIADGTRVHQQAFDLNKHKILRITVNEQVEKRKNKVLLTGATGFIGSLLLRELLLHRQELGIEGGIVLIIRAKRGQSATERANALLSKNMFSFLSDHQKQQLISAIEGDVSVKQLGLSAKDYQALTHEEHITHVINCAACVNFVEPLHRAAESNITSALHLQTFAKNVKRVKSKYVYISTAFVHGNLTGSSTSPLQTNLFNFGKYDPLDLYLSMMDSQSYASTDLGFPNTYTFSKSVCEHLLLRDKSIGTIIIRPCIVGPAVQEPFEGWAGDKPSTLVAGACLYLKNPYNIWSFRKEQAAVIPVDVVCRYIISKAFEDCKYTNDDAAFDGASMDCVSLSTSKSAEESEHSSEQSYVFPKDILARNGSSLEQRTEHSNEDGRIYTAAWDYSSPPSFQWYTFACSIVQLGSANGHIEKIIAYFVLLISFKLFLAIELTFEGFRSIHQLLVHRPLGCIKTACRYLGFKSAVIRNIERVEPFLDLPLLFFPFTTATFHFESDLKAPSQFNSERYMFSCVLAAEKFVLDHDRKNAPRSHEAPHTEWNSVKCVAGKRCKMPCSDYLWCMLQPRGNYAIRLVGFFVIKLLRSITTEVTLDLDSFMRAVQAVHECGSKTDIKGDIDSQTYIILAPTHRSYLDFILISYVAFAYPEIGISIPNIAAADDFARVPVLGLLTEMAGAFFVKRGKGVIDPKLDEKVLSLKQTVNNCIEVFLEGRRSRDRRFLEPKTGFLRCLAKTKGKHVVVPITINYEVIPEQSCLAEEANGRPRYELSILRLLKWLKSAKSGRVNLGRIHISAAPAILMRDSPELDVKKVANAIQALQKNSVVVSDFHVHACSLSLDLNRHVVHKSLEELGVQKWSKGQQSLLHLSSPTEQWSAFLHFGHIYSSFFVGSHPKWAEWMGGDHSTLVPMNQMGDYTQILVHALLKTFDSADEAVIATVDFLQNKGYKNLSPSHVLQYIRQSGCKLPSLLLRPAILSYLDTITFRNVKDLTAPIDAAINSCEGSCKKFSNESYGAWGYKDSGLVLNVNSDGTKQVTMKGNRYKISGRPMSRLVPFLERVTEITVDPLRVVLPKATTVTISRSDISDRVFNSLFEIVSSDSERITTSDIERVRHGTGHSQEDMYMIRSDHLKDTRFPDAVVYPLDEKEVECLINLAAEEGLCLIPFGGGTNVSHATWCPPKDKEPRPIISVDMRLMNKILEINEEDSTIHVQAGITGGDLVQELQSRGYTIGHEPDSIEFSTLGGWIATKASGMKQNKYGNIEQIVKSVEVVSSSGRLWQHNYSQGTSFSRVSTGTDLTSIMMGSEGSLGIITSATLKMWPLPEFKNFESVILHNFEDGLLFVKDISKLRALKPASVRLLDNTQFRLGQSMTSKNDSWLKTMKQKIAMMATSLFVDRFDPEEMVCITIALEGSRLEIELQMREIRTLASTYGGISAGNEVGKAGYDMTYAIAYIRDFAMTYGFLAESFETFVPWSKVRSLITATKDRLKREHQDRALPGNPIISCRVTQLYDDGVCVYFYFCMNFENVQNPSAVFAEIELAARKEILAQGGSLSHHHGIGKHRAPLMNEVNSENLREVLKNMKKAIDPHNIFGVANGSYS
eukprot:CAMPEP_0176499892 /NCGR_PEP_ID=MMETSP0200_2-20121128/13204_1 /TAXON_ID=947934 /ORGANISM="Chaetoceros sp., Strain GSL56" /LENGTH=2329 /DNA_ID=CAMNT_0017898411 /DNA_START=71 /DNA_END=7060 /DNA_ORIENTATION=-